MDEIIARCIMDHPLTFEDVALGICPDDDCAAPFVHGPESVPYIEVSDGTQE